MNNVKRTYVVNVAQEARKSCEQKNIIELGKTKLSLDDMHKIIEFFGGNLIKSSNETQYLEKTGEDSFNIYHLSMDDSNDRKETSILAILNALGKAFFELESMKISDVKLYSEDGFDILEYEDIEKNQMASYFAREFLMPRRLFEKVAIENWKDNSVNCNSVAKEFGVDYMYIICRGEELNIWEHNSKTYVKKYN